MIEVLTAGLWAVFVFCIYMAVVTWLGWVDVD